METLYSLTNSDLSEISCFFVIPMNTVRKSLLLDAGIYSIRFLSLLIKRDQSDLFKNLTAVSKTLYAQMNCKLKETSIVCQYKLRSANSLVRIN